MHLITDLARAMRRAGLPASALDRRYLTTKEVDAFTAAYLAPAAEPIREMPRSLPSDATA